MGGEYPLASSHAAENSDSSRSARNVGFLYVFASGFGQALCPLVVWAFLEAGASNEVTWRGTLGIGAGFAFIGLVLRVLTTVDSKKIKESGEEERERCKKEAEEEGAACESRKPFGSQLGLIRFFCRALVGTAVSWFLYDIVEYGLKQNDADILTGDTQAKAFKTFLTRVSAIPSLFVAAMMPACVETKWIQLFGFLGCGFVNAILTICFDGLHGHGQSADPGPLFFVLYILQLSFQSFPGVTTMAISADIYPTLLKGTASGISAATGKVGATLSSYSFKMLQDRELTQLIFGIVTGVSFAGAGVTCVFIPRVTAAKLERSEALAQQGDFAASNQALWEPVKTFCDEEEPENKGSTSVKRTTMCRCLWQRSVNEKQGDDKAEAAV